MFKGSLEQIPHQECAVTQMTDHVYQLLSLFLTHWVMAASQQCTHVLLAKISQQDSDVTLIEHFQANSIPFVVSPTVRTTRCLRKIQCHPRRRKHW